MNNEIKKRVIQFIAIYLIILITVIPWYITMVQKTRNTVYDAAKDKFELGMSELDAEYINILSLKKLIEKNRNYSVIKNVKDNLKIVEYDYLGELYEEYSSYVNMNFKISEAVLLFENNDVALMKNYCFSDAKLNFDKFFSFKKMNFGELKEYIFSNPDNMDKFIYDETLVINGVNKPSVVYFLPVGKNSASGEYSCMMLVIELENLYTITGFKNYIDYVDFAIRGTDLSLVYKNADEFLENEKTIMYYSGNMDTVFLANLTDEFFNSSIPYLRLLDVLVYIIIFAGAIIIYMFMYRILRGKMLFIIKELQGEHEHIKMGKEYDIAHKLIKDAKNKNIQADSLNTENHFLRYFTTSILENEKEEFLSVVPKLKNTYVMAIFANVNKKKINFEQFSQSEENSEIFVIKDTYSNDVVFISVKDKEINYIKKKVKTILLKLDEKGETPMVAVSMWCDSICEGYEKYQKTLSLMKFLDAGRNLIFSFDVNEEERKKDTFFKNIDKRILTYLEAGDEFNAGRLVYEHWYELLKKPYWDGRENQMLYKYCEFIEEFSNSKNIEIPNLEYSFETNVTEKAIMITEFITYLAKAMSNKSKSVDLISDKIIGYIDENFSDPNLGLLNLVDEFGISKKKISAVIRSKVNKKFTEYVEFKRVEKAKNLLSTTKLEILSISEECGFSNETSFYRSFKKLESVTPASYRSIYFKE